MFTPKSALFTFFAACALGVVACQPVEVATTASIPAADGTPGAAPATAAPTAQTVPTGR